MVLCRKAQPPAERPAAAPQSSGVRTPPRRTAEGGPVFFKPHRPSPLAQALLDAARAEAANRQYDVRWVAGRPRI